MLIRCYFFLDLTTPRVQKTTARVKNRAVEILFYMWHKRFGSGSSVECPVTVKGTRGLRMLYRSLTKAMPVYSFYKSKNKRFNCCFENVYHVPWILTLTPRSELQRRGRLIVHIKHLDVNHIRLYTTHVQMHHQSLKIITDPSVQLWRVSIPFVSEKKCDGSL